MARVEKDDRKAVRTGSVSADDAELAKWLHVLWARDTPPEKLELFQVFNPNASVRGKMIHQTVFKANSKYTVEDCVKLANELLASAQNDCNCVGRGKSQYELAVYDFHQRSNPLCRRIGPLFPKQQSLVMNGALGASGDDDDEDAIAPGMKPTAERYIERLTRHLELKEQAINRVIGDILIHQQQTVEDLRAHNRQLQEASFNMFLQLQDAMDRKDDRATARAMTDLKVEFIRDGRRLGRNLLLGLFGPDATTDKALPAPAQRQPASGATKVLRDVKSKVDSSLERTLIDGFLTDCEQANLLETLCGSWDDNGPVAGKQGILTPEQVTILLRVRSGALPVEMVDEIMPGYNGKHELTMEQVVKANDILPDSISQALIELKTLRDRRRATSGEQAQT